MLENSRCSCYNETIPIRVASETMQPQQQKQQQLFSQLMHMQSVGGGWWVVWVVLRAVVGG